MRPNEVEFGFITQNESVLNFMEIEMRQMRKDILKRLVFLELLNSLLENL